MNIIIINGNNNKNNTEFDNYCITLKNSLIERNEGVTLFHLYNMKLKPCQGCLSCWLKTPGDCIINDGIKDIYKIYFSSDLVLFATTIVKGFISSVLKKFLDRTIPHIHPYITLINGESRHRKRYRNYPPIAALLQKQDDTTDEDIKITSNYLKRTTDHFYSDFKFCHFMDKSIKEIINEISNLYRIPQGKKW